MSDLIARLASVSDDHLIAECQAALDALCLTDLLPPPAPSTLWASNPDPDGDRDYPGPEVCPSCNHDFELNADMRCTRCGCQC